MPAAAEQTVNVDVLGLGTRHLVGGQPPQVDPSC